jgi:hypothetical protein
MPDIQLEVLAAGCEIDSSIRIFSLTFDTTSAQFNYSLPDTLLSVYNPYVIPKDSFVTDYSRNGLNYNLVVENPSVLSASMTTSEIRFTPLKVGSSQAEVIISDDYTHKNYANHFRLDVYDPLNHAPVENSSAPKNYYPLLYDTLEINLNTLFVDEDNDTLVFEFTLSDTSGFSSWLNNSLLSLYAGSVAQTECEVSAHDRRGGIASSRINISVNRMPERNENYSTFLFQYDGNCVEIGPDSLFSDPDGDTLSFIIADSDFPATLKGYTIIEVCPVNSGSGIIRLLISDGRNGLFNDSLIIRFNAAPFAAYSEYFYEFTSGNEIIEIDLDTVFDDADNDPLTCSVVFTSSPALTYNLAGLSLNIIPGDTIPSDLIIMADDSFGGSDSSNISLTYVHDPLFFIDPQLGHQLLVYPNPAKDRIFFSMGIENKVRCIMSLMDAFGRIILSSSLDLTGPLLYELNVTDKNLNGVFLLRLDFSDGQMIIRRIVLMQ